MRVNVRVRVSGGGGGKGEVEGTGTGKGLDPSRGPAASDASGHKTPSEGVVLQLPDIVKTSVVTTPSGKVQHRFHLRRVARQKGRGKAVTRFPRRVGEPSPIEANKRFKLRRRRGPDIVVDAVATVQESGRFSPDVERMCAEPLHVERETHVESGKKKGGQEEGRDIPQEAIFVR